MSIINSESDPSNSLGWLSSDAVIFMRHAHSSAKIPDFERPVSSLGKEECKKTATIFSTIKPPILTLCSSAKRCVETVNLIEQLSGNTLIDNCEYIDELYLAPFHTIKKILRVKRIQKIKTLILAHNPGLSDILNELKFKQAPNTKLEVLATSGLFICELRNSESKPQNFDLELVYQYRPIISDRKP